MKHVTPYMHRSRTIAGLGAFFALFFCALSLPAAAQIDAFAPGWDLDRAQSNIRFQSIKNDEPRWKSSSLRHLQRRIEPDGKATIHVLLNSVDTLVDLRNVRMRFLFFETFRYPEATISLQLTPDMVADLPAVRRKTRQPRLHLRPARRAEADDVAGDDNPAERRPGLGGLRRARSRSPSADFELAENMHKLEQAVGGVVDRPVRHRHLRFHIRAPRVARRPGAGLIAAPVTSVALETPGELSGEACVGRFEVLSRTGNIYFRTGSARLDADSVPLLGSVVDIVNRCPTLSVVVSGYTDTDGNPDSNQRLSDARAQSVVNYLVDQGVTAGRLRAVGYGEANPVAPNDTAQNKSLNRRIEFAADGA